MYDREFYAKADATVVCAWKDLGKKLLGVLGYTALYAVVTPVRLYEYARDCVETERKCARDEKVRFQNMKQNGHI